MQNFEEKYPNNGLNSDDENRYLDVKDSRFILNLRAGSSNSNNIGAIENIKGTTEVNFSLPAGINKCIGSYGHQTSHSNFFFIWNSLGSHSIYRYFPKDRTVRLLIKDVILNFQEYDLINDINIVGEMIYWRDITNPPRKINYVKSDTSNPDFRQQFNWYLGDNYIAGQSSLQLEISSRTSFYDSTNSVPIIYNFSINSALPKNEIAKDLEVQINALNTGFTASQFNDFITLNATSNRFYTVEAIHLGSPIAQVIPQNFYIEFNGRCIDVIKYPPYFPVTTLVQTNNNKRNFIKDKVFQFATRYIYDDNEKSTVSPYSLNYFFDKESGLQVDSDLGLSKYNYIKIDLSVLPEIQDINDTQVIRKVEIFVKEGGLGSWKSVDVLEQSEFIDTNPSYHFYNNANYEVVDQSKFVDKFSMVPIRSKNQEIAKDMLFFGNNLDGFDNVNIDARINVGFVDETPSLPLRSIHGHIAIRSVFNGTSPGLRSQMIYYDENDKIVWGGVSPTAYADVFLESNQEIPLGGFVVYLVGTDYKATTVQSGGIRKKIPGQAYSDFINNDIKPLIYTIGMNQPDGRNYFEIPNVPAGKYFLRVASHLTTNEEYNDPLRPYERTSTNLFKINGVITNEILIDTTIPSTIPSAPSYYPPIGIEVLDLTSADDAVQIITGYTCDNDVTTSTNYNDILIDTRISNSMVEFMSYVGAPSQYLNPLSTKAWSDHNGYFYFAAKATSPLKIAGIGHDGVNGYFGYSVEKNGKTLIYNGKGYLELAIRAIVGGTDNVRTKVKGKTIETRIVPNTTSTTSATIALVSEIFNSNVIASGSQPTTTNIDGEFEFWDYSIIKNSTRNSILIVSRASIGSFNSYSLSVYTFNFDYTWWYDLSLPDNSIPSFINNGTSNRFPLTLQIPSIEMVFEGEAIRSIMKGNWEGSFGLVYSDEGLRSGDVNTSTLLSSKTFIPTGRQDGLPIYSWEIKHIPPKWATHYHWVRTKNKKTGRYIQWITNQSTLVWNGTSYTVRINLTNLFLHATNRPLFNINMDFDSPNLRVKVIRYQTNSGVVSTVLEDFKVTKFDGTSLTLEYNPYPYQYSWGGRMALFEIYEEIKGQSNDVYYEIAETFEVGTDANGNKYHKGLAQDQDPLNPIITPATGTFRSGDSYYRRTDFTSIIGLQNIFDDSVSDYYDSAVSNIGRPGAINPDAKQQWNTTQLRHSNKYIPNSNVNGLSYFVSDGFNQLPMEYGAINKLILASNILMSIHEFRWVSNFIEESIMRKQDGTDQLIAASAVFGGFRAPENITGTINQESVQEYKGNIYAFDLNQGVSTRWGADGLTEISNYKMVNYFAKKSKEILTTDDTTPIRIISAFDTDHDEYLITFPTLKDINGVIATEAETISFSEPLNKWITFYSFTPELYGRIDLSMISFKDGKLWIHDDSNIHNNFYNEQFASQIEIGFNDKPQQVKVFKALGIESYHPWTAKSVKTPNGMETIMYKARFVKKEDSYFSEVMKDLNSDGFPNQNEALLNGRDLRDRTISVLLENDELDEVVLFSVSMLSILSTRHQK